ncbi:general stress protein [Sporosarcina luteola]|uniref:general stress protein n=1 Tax=Sporosarcina luteola TaxID=582850 RepID=UPI00203CF3E7|nr:general stress protein [Sporosarcina luteola]MCM3709003.1 general stress protein [Sporosarcina luteola]
MNKTFIGSFPNSERLMSKILELKHEGVEEEDLYIVMKDDLAIDELRSNALQEGEDSPYNLFNHFMGFLAGEQNVRRLLKDAGFSDNEAKRYFDAVQEGALLLYMNGKLKKDHSNEPIAVERKYEGYKPIPLDEAEASPNS